MEYRNYYGTPRDAVDGDMLDSLLDEKEPYGGQYGSYGKSYCGDKGALSENRTVRETSKPDCRGNYTAGRQNGGDADDRPCDCGHKWENPSLYGNPLAIVYSPVQEFEDLHELDDGFMAGTVFKKLDKPFAPGCLCRCGGVK